ncbi:MAG: ABC transporter permease [Deltaproteobacteria bacterium]|nr:ABC transporter permease [Deltaproteobacteria bacterium]
MRTRAATSIAIALLIAMAAASLLILAYGQSPGHVYAVLLGHTWGDRYGLGQVLFKSTPLIFTGLAVAVAFQAGLFNIGAEGQLLVGGLAMALVGARCGGLPAPLAIGLCLAAGALAGAALGALPGWLRARFGAHEVINTIMLNFIAQALALWLGRRFFFVEQTVHTPAIADCARLPALGLAGSAASVGFALALLAAIAVHGLMRHTRLGFELRALGQSATAAAAGGVAIGRAIVVAMALSGGLAGLVGAGTVLGYKGYYEEGIASGSGFMGIAVALLGRNRPLWIVPAALLFGTLAHGGLAVNALVPKEIVEVIQAIVILAIAASSSDLQRLAAQGQR